MLCELCDQGVLSCSMVQQPCRKKEHTYLKKIDLFCSAAHWQLLQSAIESSLGNSVLWSSRIGHEMTRNDSTTATCRRRHVFTTVVLPQCKHDKPGLVEAIAAQEFITCLMSHRPTPIHPKLCRPLCDYMM